jgi:hypothetical protein
MNYSEKISEFIDGELSHEEVSELFHSIANQPDLQNELRNAMMLKNMFHQELLTPPPLSKTLVYGKLNLQKSAVIISFLLTAFLNLKRFVMTPAFGSALISIALLTMGLFMSNTNSNKSPVNPPSKISKNQEIIKPENPNFGNQIPVVSSFENSNFENPENQITQNNIDNSKLRNSNLRITNLDNAKVHKLNSQNRKNQIINSDDFGNSALASNQSSVSQLNNIIAESPFLYKEIGGSSIDQSSVSLQNKSTNNFMNSLGYEISSILESLSITINKTLTSSTTQTNLQPLSSPLLNNYSISLAYTLDHHNAFSAELGQENFQQKYNGYINGDEANIDQVYTAQWYGLSYQYNFGEINGLMGINPYTKILIGGTNIGPFLKGSVGLTYQLTDKIAVQGGLEVSRLYYSFQGNSFNSDKYGLIYGVRIGF